MSDSLTMIFHNRKLNTEKLLSYGFEKKGESLVYAKTLSESGFIMQVTVTSEGNVAATVTDSILGEPYILHLTKGAVGSFVCGVKSEYEALLTDIAQRCGEADVFQCALSKQLIAFVREQYGDEPEFLWTKFPDNAVWRRKDTKKWYGALLKVSKRKLGLASDEMVEILDLRISPEEGAKLIDGQRYYPGYHMNKKHWFTIILDGSVSFEELWTRLQDSHSLAVK